MPQLVLLTNNETDETLPSIVAVQGADRIVVPPGKDTELNLDKGQIQLSTQPADPSWPHSPEISIGIRHRGTSKTPKMMLYAGKEHEIEWNGDYNFALDRRIPMTLALQGETVL